MAQKHVEQDAFADDEAFAGDDSSGFNDDSHHQDGFSSAHDDGDDDLSNSFDESDPDAQGFDAQLADADSIDDAQVAPLAGQPKPFLKSPFGIAVVGLATLSVVGIGVAGFRLSQGNAVEDIQATRQGSANTKAEVPAGEVDFGAAADITVAGEAREVVHNVAPVTAPKTAAQVLNMAQPVVEPVVPAPTLALPPSTPAPVVASAISPELLAEQDALKKRVEEQQASTDELAKNVASINQALARLSAVVEKNGETEILLGEQVKALNGKLEHVSPVVAPVAAPEGGKDVSQPSKAVVLNANPKVEGRVRVPGLQVVDSTASGHMVVVKKVSNGRVFTMFKGERIGTPKGSQKVVDVLDKGTLLLIGDKYYIDTSVEDEAEARRAPQVKPQAEPKKAVEPKREAPVKPAQEKPKVVKSSVLKNYTLNAVYDNNNSFGVVTNSGDFKTYKVGENVQGVGVVEGLDSDGNLKVGNFVIESVY